MTLRVVWDILHASWWYSPSRYSEVNIIIPSAVFSHTTQNKAIQYYYCYIIWSWLYSEINTNYSHVHFLCKLTSLTTVINIAYRSRQDQTSLCWLTNSFLANSYTPRTVRACCSQSKFRILEIRESSARALFLYNCTPTSRAVLTRAWASRRVDLRERRVDWFSERVIIFVITFKLTKMSYLSHNKTVCLRRVWIRLTTAYLLCVREFRQNNALALQFWCLSNALTLRVRALDASKSQRACIILSKFTRKSKYPVINL